MMKTPLMTAISPNAITSANRPRNIRACSAVPLKVPPSISLPGCSMVGARFQVIAPINRTRKRPMSSSTQPRTVEPFSKRIGPPQRGQTATEPSAQALQVSDRQMLWSAMSAPFRLVPDTKLSRFRAKGQALEDSGPPVAKIPDLMTPAAGLGLVARLGPAAGPDKKILRALCQPFEVAALVHHHHRPA